MSSHPISTTNFGDDGTSGSGEDINMLNGHWLQSGMPSSSAPRKRGHKATADAIVDAMLEIAAASKLRATAIIQKEDPFSISKCIKVLDEMGLDKHIYFLVLDLFENPMLEKLLCLLRARGD